jgi:hypothetical protein
VWVMVEIHSCSLNGADHIAISGPEPEGER